MRTFLALLLMTTAAYSQTVNNATVNLQGANQNVSISQSNSGHSINLDLRGDNITFIGSQYGSMGQSYSITINCGTSCPTSPYIVTQY